MSRYLLLKTTAFSALLFVFACVPRYTPPDLKQLQDPQALGEASRHSYLTGKSASTKQERLKLAQAGIQYSDKCLKIAPEESSCLYYNVLSRGLFLQNHVLNYQKALKLMVQNCKILIRTNPAYENAGCYRVLGDIYAKAPAFSFRDENIIQDLDKSVEYLRKAVELAPNYPLNHLLLARSLLSIDEKEQAREQLEQFNQLPHDNLDKVYPGWKKEHEQLERELSK